MNNYSLVISEYSDLTVLCSNMRTQHSKNCDETTLINYIIIAVLCLVVWLFIFGSYFV